MQPIQIPTEPPAKLRTMTGQQLRSAFQATVLAQIPPSYRNQLRQTGDYREMWEDSIRVLNLYKTQMEASTGADWTPDRQPTMPDKVTPTDVMRSAIESQDAARAAAGNSFVNKRPIQASNYPGMLGSKPAA